MVELLQENWIIAVVALVVLALILIWAALANRKTKVEFASKDEVGSAKRNQALIDSAPAATAKPADPPASSPEPEPAPVATPAPVSADDLSRIKGLGPKLNMQLSEMGITSFAQIAAWDDAEIDRIDAQLGRFQGRIRRDNWVEQAKLLTSGDGAAYAEKFGNQ